MAALRFRFAPPTTDHGAGGNLTLTINPDHSVGAGHDLMNGFADRFANPDLAKVMLGLGGDKPSAMFVDKLDEAYAENAAMIGLVGMSKQQFNDLAFGQGKANFGALHEQWIGPFRQAMADVTGKLVDTLADAHRRSLGDTLLPETRIEKMKEFDWRVIHTAAPLILPDCVAIATGAKGEAFPPMLEEEDDEADTLYVPLSSDRLLVGSKRSAKVPKNLNDMFAECSWDFFIARDRTAELESLKQKLRSGVSKLTDDTINGAISGTAEKFGGAGN